MTPTASLRLFVLVALALGALVLLVDRLVVTDAERLEALPQQLSSAISSEVAERVAELVTGDFSFAGPPPVHSGDYEESFERLDDFWRQVHSLELNWRDLQVDRARRLATIEASGLVRFRLGDMLVLYRAHCRLVCVREDDGWRLQRLDVVELRRGLF